MYDRGVITSRQPNQTMRDVPHRSEERTMLWSHLTVDAVLTQLDSACSNVFDPDGVAPAQRTVPRVRTAQLGRIKGLTWAKLGC